MNSVIGITSLLLDAELDDECARMVEMIRDSGSTLLLLINDILDVSKIEAGALDIEDVPYDLRGHVEAIMAPLHPRATDKGIALSSTVADDVPPVITGDPMRVRQVLTNLLDNAIKFTAEGEVSLEIWLEPASDEGTAGPRLHLRVTDSGIGLTEEQRLRLFEAFRQGDASISRNYGGTGLGLMICRGLVERMGGGLDVQSRVAEGSTFHCTIPTTIVDDPALAPAGRRATSSFDDELAIRCPLRILVVDDNQINRLVAQKMLVKFGYRPETANGGALGIERARNEDFDLVLMDVQMPEVDGLEATRRIRDPATGPARQPQIAAMTANVMQDDRDACREAGMDDYIGKPLVPEALSRILTTASAAIRAKE